MNGVLREFIFDIGLLIIFFWELVDLFELEVLGENIGWDVNGIEVSMLFVWVVCFEIGEFVFIDVFVFVFDFFSNDMGCCVIDGGVIGLEILLGSWWWLDV